MPTEPIKPRKKSHRDAMHRQAPEPSNRMLHREAVSNRREIKRSLREAADEYSCAQ